MSFKIPTESIPLRKPPEDCRVALLSTSGAYVKNKQEPFNTKSKYGDDSYRIIPAGTPAEEIGLSHPGYDTRRSLKDIDCVFPIRSLRVLQDRGIIGEVAPRHFSFMGFVPYPETLIWRTAPEVGRMLIDDKVDLIILVPA